MQDSSEEARFGELRSILQTSPSQEAWHRLTLNLERWSNEQLIEKILPYANAHLKSWDEALRRAPRRWVERIFSDAPPPYTPLLRTLDLTQRGLSDRDVEHLCSSHTLTHIRRLDLSHNWLMAPGVEHLCRTSHAHALTHLNLSYNQLGDQGAEAFQGTNTLGHLMHLNLSRNDLSTRGVQGLLHARFIRSLCSLDLSSNWIREDLGDAFAHTSCESLTHLTLASNHIGDRGISTLLEAQHALPVLHTLNVHHTHLTADAASAIAWSPMTSQLRHLDLSDNQLANQGVNLLCDSSHLSNLAHLNLNNNQLRDASMLAMGDTPHLNALESLALSKNWLTHAGITHLVRTRSLTALRSLDLSRNTCDEQGIDALCGWPQLRLLHHLDLAGNEINTRACATLFAHLQESALRTLTLDHNPLLPRQGHPDFMPCVAILSLAHLPPVLESLSLVNCFVTDRTLLTLLDAPHVHRLRHLDLRYNPLNDSSAEALAQCEKLGNLITLDLRYTKLSANGIALLLDSPHLSEEVKSMWRPTSRHHASP